MISEEQEEKLEEDTSWFGVGVFVFLWVVWQSLMTVVAMFPPQPISTPPQPIKPTLMVFTATWCGPCHQAAPVIAELEASGLVNVVRYDADKDWEVLKKYGVKLVPTFILGDYVTNDIAEIVKRIKR